jgi:hypothetical protein
MGRLVELSSEKVIDQVELTKDETEEHTAYMRSPIVITKRLSPAADFFWRLLTKWGAIPPDPQRF